MSVRARLDGWAARGLAALAGRVVVLAVVIGVGVYALPKMIDRGAWVALGVSVAAAAGLIWLYAGSRAVAVKYLAPGTLLLLAFQVYPVLYTISTATSNYGDGHLLSKDQAIHEIVESSVTEVPGRPRYKLSVVTSGDPATAAFEFVLTAPGGAVYDGTEQGLRRIDAAQVTRSASGKVIAVRGRTVFTAVQINARSEQIAAFRVPVGTGSDRGAVRSVGISEAYVGRARVTYDAGKDTLTDARTGLIYRPHDGFFVATDGSGRRFDTGWKTNVGFANVRAVFGNPDIRGPLLSIFVWTIAFALLSVVIAFVLGLLLAVALDHPNLRGKRLYRSLLLLPYALPAFISLLVWQSMYNRDFGLLNQLLHTRIDWLGGEWSARMSVLLTNVWLTFPYMFLICTGVLQAIPAELREAARVDGAGAAQVFRSVTMPLLMVSVTPLLIASFALNFNNYNAIKLLTNGGPFPPENSTAGDTDILISYTFRIAFGGQGAQYGLAATISIAIFVIIAAISFVGFRNTRQLEEVYR